MKNDGRDNDSRPPRAGVEPFRYAYHQTRIAQTRRGRSAGPGAARLPRTHKTRRRRGATGDSARLIRGRALIIWDPKVPGKKRDAIDTDQITPAADCVSESLELLDERWKAGAFRHLIPDFRARVHRGETFLIAGDRFAIGSSREMSPAGLKAVAEEAGLELVVVCGRQMGDIFRRNSFNLGLHVLECPEAVADAQDGDTLTFDPSTRALANETQGRAYQPVPLAPKEEEIRRGGGIFAVGRRELRRSIERTPRIIWPDEKLARRMSTTEQILWAHRVDKTRDGASRARRCVSTPICCRPRTARRRSRSTRSIRSRAVS